MYGPNVAEIIQSAEAHGVQAQLQSRFIQITNEAISRQSLSTGETLVLSGALVSLVEREQRGWISLFSESTNSGNRWEIMARDPPGVVFEIPGNSITPYAITAKALEPGVYHVHTQLNVANVGTGSRTRNNGSGRRGSGRKTNPMGNACVSEHYHCSCLCHNIRYKTLASNLTDKPSFSF